MTGVIISRNYCTLHLIESLLGTIRFMKTPVTTSPSEPILITEVQGSQKTSLRIPIAQPTLSLPTVSILPTPLTSLPFPTSSVSPMPVGVVLPPIRKGTTPHYVPKISQSPLTIPQGKIIPPKKNSPLH